MKQLAAREARVAALKQKLQDQAYLTNPPGDALTRRDHPQKSRAMPWCPSPVTIDHYNHSVPANVPRSDWYDFSLTPSSSLLK